MQVCVLTDTTTGKAVPLPEDLRALLEAHPSSKE
jgi:acyl-CoA thioesterase FadM